MNVHLAEESSRDGCNNAGADISLSPRTSHLLLELVLLLAAAAAAV